MAKAFQRSGSRSWTVHLEPNLHGVAGRKPSVVQRLDVDLAGASKVGSLWATMSYAWKVSLQGSAKSFLARSTPVPQGEFTGTEERTDDRDKVAGMCDSLGRVGTVHVVKRSRSKGYHLEATETCGSGWRNCRFGVGCECRSR